MRTRNCNNYLVVYFFLIYMFYPLGTFIVCNVEQSEVLLALLSHCHDLKCNTVCSKSTWEQI